MKNWPNRLINWLFLPLLGLLVGMAVAEGLLRMAGISFPVFDTYDELRGVSLRAGKEGWYRKEGEAYLRINSLGYRDHEHEITKPAGTFRIAVLGDSFAEARQVAQEDTFWSLLGKKLSACPDFDGKTVEVLNFGIGGYGTAQELLTLRKDALRFSPDLVLLAFFAENDLRDNSRLLSQREGWRMPAPYFVPVDGGLELDASFREARGHRLMYEAVHHLRVLEVVNEARRHLTLRSIPVAEAQAREPAEGLYAPPVDPAWRESWEITEALLGLINQEVRASGAGFAVTTLSLPAQVHPDRTVREALQRRLGVEDLFYSDRRVAEIGQKLGFPVIRLGPTLQRIATETQTSLHGFENSVMGEGHYNEAGHRYSALILADGLCGTTAPPERSI